MDTAVKRIRKPNIQPHFPIWWHRHGLKMQVVEFDRGNCLLVIKGSAAKVTIIRTDYEAPHIDINDGWLVSWEVIQQMLFDETVRGRRLFDEDELAAAFGLIDDHIPDSDKLMVTRHDYDVDSLAQGKYARRGLFLNIPCLGTGHDGDPNVSICIDDNIQDAVRQLLAL